MECGEPRTIGGDSGAHQQAGDAVLHLLGSFIGEGDRENRLSANAMRNKIGHAEGDGARFSGTSASENQYWPFGSFGGETLFRIQRFEKVLHLFSQGCKYKP